MSDRIVKTPALPAMIYHDVRCVHGPACGRRDTHAAELSHAEMAIQVVRPGDRVLLVPARDFSPSEAQAYRDRLGEKFPGVEFVFAAGLTTAVVQPKED
jgi:hypothetical protein